METYKLITNWQQADLTDTWPHKAGEKNNTQKTLHIVYTQEVD